MARPKDVLSAKQYKAYRNVRAVSVLFILLGGIFVLGGILHATGSGGGRDLPLGAAVVFSVVGAAGVVGGIGVLTGSRGWAGMIKVMAWVYVWGFPVGTILSLVLLDGLPLYFKSLDRLREWDEGEGDEEYEWEEDDDRR